MVFGENFFCLVLLYCARVVDILKDTSHGVLKLVELHVTYLCKSLGVKEEEGVYSKEVYYERVHYKY